jgi:hypothetical protein
MAEWYILLNTTQIEHSIFGQQQVDNGIIIE